MREVQSGALDSFKEALDYMDAGDIDTMVRRDEPHDTISEAADSNVPIYNGDLLDLAAGDNNLAYVVPELGPAFDGSPTPINIIAANVYEAIEAHLWEWWQANKDNLLVECEACKGIGWTDEAQENECPICKSEGQVKNTEVLQ